MPTIRASRMSTMVAYRLKTSGTNFRRMFNNGTVLRSSRMSRKTRITGTATKSETTERTRGWIVDCHPRMP